MDIVDKDGNQQNLTIRRATLLYQAGCLEQQFDPFVKVIRKQFASDLKAMIEAKGMKRRQMYLYISEIKHLIDETLNAK